METPSSTVVVHVRERERGEFVALTQPTRECECQESFNFSVECQGWWHVGLLSDEKPYANQCRAHFKSGDSFTNSCLASRRSVLPERLSQLLVGASSSIHRYKPMPIDLYCVANTGRWTRILWIDIELNGSVSVKLQINTLSKMPRHGGERVRKVERTYFTTLSVKFRYELSYPTARVNWTVAASRGPNWSQAGNFNSCG